MPGIGTGRWRRSNADLLMGAGCGFWFGRSFFGRGSIGLRWSGLGRSEAEAGVDVSEAGLGQFVQVSEADGLAKFTIGAGDGFGHDLGEVGESAGRSYVEIADGDGEEEAAERGGEGSIGDEVRGQAGSDPLACFEGVVNLIGVLLVKMTELRGFVFLEHAALAAVGEEERA